MPEDSGTKLRSCGKCTEEKPASEFNKDSRAKDGLRTYCRSCHRESSRLWREANKDKAKAARRRWNSANKDRKAEYDRRWAAANKDKVKESSRRWEEKNPKRVAYRQHKGHAKARGIDFLLTFEEWCDWWGDDFCNRGCTKGKLVMARHGDQGPYALWNIKKVTHSENAREAHEFRKFKDKAVCEV
jgi:hypothetical protein